MKVLFVNYTMNIGGIEKFLLNISKELVDNNIEVDFLCYSKDKFDLENEISKLGSKIIKINDPYKVSSFKHFKELYNVIKNGNYDVVHSNTFTNSSLVMFASFLSKVKVRVTHSHTSQKPKNLFQRIKWVIAKIFISLFSNRKIACSKTAGDSLFYNKYELLENGVNVENFKFNKRIRNDLRSSLNISNNDIVIGHIGRFAKVKNHEYLIEIFKKIHKQNNNYKLLLVGDGSEFKNINKKVDEYNLKDYVLFTGNVSNPNDYMNVMDLILFPSFYEGLPLTLVEAQINGLNIIASDTITSEINLFGNVKFFNLNDNIDNVINLIKNTTSRNINDEYFKTSYYNIKNTYNKLMKIYRR